jgi:hypothetical protein
MLIVRPSAVAQRKDDIPVTYDAQVSMKYSENSELRPESPCSSTWQRSCRRHARSSHAHNDNLATAFHGRFDEIHGLFKLESRRRPRLHRRVQFQPPCAPGRGNPYTVIKARHNVSLQIAQAESSAIIQSPPGTYPKRWQTFQSLFFGLYLNACRHIPSTHR